MRSFETIVADTKNLYKIEYELLTELLKKVELIKESYDNLEKEIYDSYPQMNLEIKEALDDSYEYFMCQNAIDRLMDHYDPPSIISFNND